VDYIADQTVGSGFFTTADQPEAKRVVDGFAEDVGLDQLLMQASKELLWGGNSIWEKIEPDALTNLKILPLSTFRGNAIYRDEFGQIIAYVQRVSGKEVRFRPEELIHFRYNIVDVSPWGIGLINPLAEVLEVDAKNTRPPLLGIKAQVETSIPRILKRYLAPKIVWNVEGATDPEFEEIKREIQEAPEDVDFVSGGRIKTTASPVPLDPRARFETFFSYLETQLIAGLQTPIIKLFSTSGFTEASAKVIREIAQKKIEYLGRILRRTIERQVFAPLLEQNGFDPKEANIRLHFGLIEKPKPELKDVVALAQISAQTGVQYVKAEEVRAILRDLGWKLQEEMENGSSDAA